MTDKIRQHINARKARLAPDDVRMEAYDDVLAYIDKLEKREGPNARERYETVLDAAQRAVGITLSAGRSQEDVDIRLLVIKQMRDEGYSNSVVGLLLHRDHSTVSYNYKVVNEMMSMPGAFSKFMHVYKRFKEELQ